MTLNISCQSLLACKVSFKKSANGFIEIPLQVTLCFSPVLLRFFILNLWHFNYDVSWSVSLCIHLWDSLCFLFLHVYFLHLIREVFFHYLSKRFPISCSFSSPSGTPMIQMLDLFKLSTACYTILVFLIRFSSSSD